MAKSTSSRDRRRTGFFGRVALVLGVAACGSSELLVGNGEDGSVATESGLDGSLDALLAFGPDGADGSGLDGMRQAGLDASLDGSFNDGSDGAVDGSFEEAASDESLGDASDAANDSESTDAADAGCGVDGTPCNYNGMAGLCKSSLCVPCRVSMDDAVCMAAYGSPSNPYLCVSGTCIPGDCRTNGDCALNPNGPLCGVSTPNLCGMCTIDTQCVGNAGGSVCNTGTGACVDESCPSDGGAVSEPPSSCPANPSDVCCSGACVVTGTGGVACCSDDPAAAAYCSAQLDASAQCVNNICTSCVPGPDNAYTVDPNAGSDAIGNGNVGNGNPESCAFKTITRALQVIGSSPAVPVTVTVLPSTVGPGETFPIVVPANVTLTTLTPYPEGGVNPIATDVTVNVPAGKAGFVFGSPSSTMLGFGASYGVGWTLQGGDAGTYGIIVTTGGAATIEDVNPYNFVDDGILVEGSGVLSMTSVISMGNGMAGPTNGKAGLHVRDSGHAIVSGTYEDSTYLSSNWGFGIQVDDTGYVTIGEHVTAAENDNLDVWIGQTPGAAAPRNVINSLVTSAYPPNIEIVAGSNVQFRNCTLGGVVIQSAVGSSGGDDISQIDLGTNPDAGGSYGNNKITLGICLAVQPNSGTLEAEGNIFGALDCATSTGSVGVGVGCYPVGSGILNPTGNAIDVAMCTP